MAEIRAKLDNSVIDVIQFSPDNPPKTNDIGNDKLVAVMLKQLIVRNLYAEDGSKTLENREGTLTCTIKSPHKTDKGVKETVQETTLSWATGGDKKLKNLEKFGRQLLFFGKHSGHLDLEVNLIETDQDTVEALKKAKDSLGIVSKVAGFLPGPAGLISAGVGLVGGILDFIRSRKDDDQELLFLGSLGNLSQINNQGSLSLPLNQGRYIILRKGVGASPDLEVHFSVVPISKPDEAAQRALADQKILIVLDHIELDLSSGFEGFTFLIESAFGGEKDGSKFSFKSRLKNKEAFIQQIVGLQNKILYAGPWNIGIPYDLSVALVNDRSELEALEGLIDSASGFVKEFTDDEKDKHVDNITKAVQSFRSHAIEMLPKKVSVGKQSGLITADVNKTKYKLGKLNQSNLLISFDDLKVDRWCKPVEVKLKSKKGGSAALYLKAKFL